jgi:hypothetical protein
MGELGLTVTLKGVFVGLLSEAKGIEESKAREPGMSMVEFLTKKRGTMTR